MLRPYGAPAASAPKGRSMLCSFGFRERRATLARDIDR